MRAPRAQAVFAIILVISTIWIIAALVSEPRDPAAGRLPLLAVSVDEEGNEGPGGVAYLDLRIVPGEGRVYIHSDPLTKVDTQAATTFAQRYACDQAEVNCDRYDFLYSIESSAPIVGGPSAGAATAALTYAMLTEQSVPRDVAVTGTISSGGVIGTVGGIPQKLDAAAEEGLSRVIIPYLADENASENATIQTYRAQTFDEMIISMGLVGPRGINETIIVPPAYTRTMQEVAADLCEGQELALVLEDTQTVRLAYERIENLSNDAAQAGEREEYYTQASYCFNIRVQHYYLELYDQTRSLSDIEASAYVLESIDANMERADGIFSTFDERVDTLDLNDIQIYSIVEERYRESETIGDELFEEVSESRADDRERFDDDTLYSLSYMLARIDSMESWMRFSGFEQGETISRSALKQACTKKLSEASEQAEYTAYLTGMNALDIDSVYEAHRNGDYAVCIYQASLITARAETFLSTIGVDLDELPLLYDAKSQAAYRQIAEQTASGNFPVMAYSYLEYAQSLRESNLQTALLYIENALELAELELYFESSSDPRFELERDSAIPFALGIFTMSGLGLIITASNRPIGKKRKSRAEPKRSSVKTSKEEK